jgi:hypothetical protein
LLSVAIVPILVLTELIGAGWTNTLSSALSFVGLWCAVVVLLYTPSALTLCLVPSLRLLVLTIKYGEEMRAWVDIGYSTAEIN